MKILQKNWTHWQWYKSFFSISILRYFVIWFSVVPILAQWLSQIPEGKIYFRSIKSLNGTQTQIDPVEPIAYFSISLGLPFNWELLWASSLFFVLALASYVIFCPSFIRKYPSFKEYKLHFHSPRWIVWEAINIVKDKSERNMLFERLDIKKYLKIEKPFKENAKTEVIVEHLQTKFIF